MTYDNREIIDSFLDEATDWGDKFVIYAEEIEETGLADTTMNDIFRGVHSLKGTAGFIADSEPGVEPIAAFCHKFETYLDGMRKNSIRITAFTLTVVCDALIALGRDIDILSEGGEPEHHDDLLRLFNPATRKDDAADPETTLVYKIEKDLTVWEEVDSLVKTVFHDIESSTIPPNLVFDLQGKRLLSSQAIGAIMGFSNKTAGIYIVNPSDYMNKLFNRLQFPKNAISIKKSLQECY